MTVAWCSLASTLLIFALFARAQRGFISIDCGIAEQSTYEEDDTIRYSSDDGFIDTGVNGNLPQAAFSYSLRRLYHTVRSFPNGIRNCYTLKPVEKDSKYLVRAYFLYGNYDGKNNQPQFDLYLDVNLWMTISNASMPFYTDIITITKMDFISVCLVNTGLGTPFISALELRPLKKSMYIASNETQSLVLLSRLDVGSNTYTRYPNDPNDLIWNPNMDIESWRQINTTLTVEILYRGFEPPSNVMKTAVKPAIESNRLEIEWSVSDPDLQIYVFRHFAELELLKSNMTRELDVCCSGDEGCFGSFRPEYLVTRTVYSIIPLSGQKKYYCWFSKTANSTLPPILNAFETYTALQLSNTATKPQEVEAMIGIKAAYKVKRNWMGDPCLPKDYPWEGLTCNYPDSSSPTIATLDLSSTGLDGEIALSLANLTSIKSLDLSWNKLSGPIPDFLGDLPSLSLLNLSGNQLNGTIPLNLLERSSKGLLKLSVENNPSLNFSDPSSIKSTASSIHTRKITILVVASIASVIFLSLLIILWILKWRKRGRVKKVNRADGLIQMNDDILYSENRQFTYAEVVEMTNNFERAIGNGGFGTVYYGQVRNGTQVAVKMLSPQSVKSLSHRCQGLNEFQNEVQLLTRIHHKNLVPFIGYCKEGDNMALIYEYMAQGSLSSHLSGTSSQSLSWSQRLRIALDVAQGLEYLHNYCKPPIIHRDMKATNILLNEKFEAKIGDFGMSKVFLKDDERTHVSTAIKGTHGYLDPEYYSSNHLTEKSDVYSFGVVVLQLITGHPAIIQTSDYERTNVTEWIRPFVTEGNIRGMIDPRLEGDYNVNSVWKAVEIALASIPPISIERPTMSEVVAELKECLETEIAKEINRSIKIDQVELSSSFYPLPR